MAKVKETPKKYPKFIDEKIREIRKQTFLDDEPENVQVNAPRALTQVSGEGQLIGICWVLRQPLYAAAPDLLTVCEGIAFLGLMNKNYKPEDILVMLSKLADKARAAIAKAERPSDAKEGA